MPGVKLEDLAPLHWSRHTHHQVGQGGHLFKEKYRGGSIADQMEQLQHLFIVDIEGLRLPVGGHLLLAQVKPVRQHLIYTICYSIAKPMSESRASARQ